MQNELQIEMGKRIYTIRKELGYSGQHMADQLGISRQTYAKLEKGGGKLTFEMMYKLCDILECLPDELFYGHHGARCKWCQYRD